MSKDHCSATEFPRDGHWRHYSNGKKVWISRTCVQRSSKPIAPKSASEKYITNNTLKAQAHEKVSAKKANKKVGDIVQGNTPGYSQMHKAAALERLKAARSAEKTINPTMKINEVKKGPVKSKALGIGIKKGGKQQHHPDRNKGKTTTEPVKFKRLKRKKNTREGSPVY
jgi:hypothetical protein